MHLPEARRALAVPVSPHALLVWLFQHSVWRRKKLRAAECPPQTVSLTAKAVSPPDFSLVPFPYLGRTFFFKKIFFY